MDINVIICILMLLKVGEAGQYCFDDTIGYIQITLTDALDVEWDYTKWSLTWNDDNWSSFHPIPKGEVGVSTGRGCCSGGFVRIFRPRGQQLICHFKFSRETRILCDSGIAYCSFPVILSKTIDGLFYVSGAITCNCVHGYNTEATGVTWEDFEANSTDAQIENLIVTKLNHSFN